MEARASAKATYVLRYGDGGRSPEDLLAVEEPLEIRLELGPVTARVQRSIAVTMRTPGHDLELAAGFLYGEGILRSAAAIHKIDWCRNVKLPEEHGNVVKVDLKPEERPDLSRMERNFYTTSSCGVCGKASIEAITVAGCPVLTDSGVRHSPDLIRSLPHRALASQLVFKHTGGIHAASIFDREGQLLVLREDIGRHNAVDKAIGHLLLAGTLALEDGILLLSGRAGFELVQKAIVAGIGTVVAVGAPSSLAVDLARQHGLTLAGFLRGDRFNVYSGEFRILREPASS